MKTMKIFKKILNWKHGILAFVVIFLTMNSFAFIETNHLSWYFILIFIPFIWAVWMFGCYLFTDKKYKKYWRLKR